MEEQLITFETAKLAKDKGFNIETSYALIKSNSGIETKMIFDYQVHELFTFIAWLPTQSLLQKWLREKHKIDVYITIGKGLNENDYHELHYIVNIHKSQSNQSSIVYDTYEEALEQGLTEALNAIKTPQAIADNHAN